MKRTELYESPDISVLTLATEQGFAQSPSASIEPLTIEEEEW